MRPKLVKNNVRQFRVQRSNPVRVDVDDTSQTWAVSYADFLMVLLSFFVIFFSTEKEKKNSIIFQIVSDFSKSGKLDGKSSQDKSREPNMVGTSTLQNKNLPAFPDQFAKKMHQSFGAILNHSTIEKDKIIINLPDNIYGVGEYDLYKNAHAELKRILLELEPYLPQLSVGFIGHADSKLVARRAGREIQNNFDISVLRASRALSLAVDMGFDPSHLYASGSGPKLRESRSLSIVLRPYSGGTL